MNIMNYIGVKETTKDNNYLGWTNKATYLFSLDVFNQELSYRYWGCRAEKLSRTNYTEAKDILADEMRDYVLGEKEEYDNLMVDLVECIAGEINFYEVASQVFEQITFETIGH